ncbi:hypothetical protein AAVH_25047 [Aphelenchoides avenae]|nr:hypothetical protein AAVH_25047 [Aphelenchus avenae]
MKPLRKWTLPRAWTISRRCAFGDWVCFFCSLFLLGFNCVMWAVAFRSLTQSLDLLSGKIAFVLVNGLFSSIIVAVLYAPLKIISVPIRAMYYENAVFEWTTANEGVENRPRDTVLHI